MQLAQTKLAGRSAGSHRVQTQHLYLDFTLVAVDNTDRPY